MFRRIGHVYVPPLQTARQEVASLISAGLELAGAKVLDVGCGTGVYSIALVEAGARRVLGLDVEKENISLASTLAHPLLEFRHMDVGEVVPTEQFDVVFARGVLYYFQDIEEVLHRLAGLLHPGGVLYATLTASTFRARILNLAKHAAVASPVWMRPVLRDLAASIAYALGRMGGGDSWTLTKQKTGTLFFPQYYLHSPSEAQAMLRRVGFSEIRPAGNLSGNILSSEFGLLAFLPEGDKENDDD